MASGIENTRLIVPLTCPTIDEMAAGILAAASAGADLIECRLDYLETPPTPAELDKLLADSPVEIIATNRPTDQGGHFTGSEADRLAILTAAATAGAKLIDIERGVSSGDWPDAKIIHSHHDFDRCPDDLGTIVDELAATSADIPKVAFMPAGPDEALVALDIIRQTPKPTIALAMGEAGLLSRILARKVGAFGTFASLSAGAGSAPGQPTISELIDLYRWESISATTNVFGVIGCPVGHSMSPAIHNAAFDATGYDGVYLPILIQPGGDNFNRFIDGLLDRPWLGWRGLSVTLPHKENALACVGGDNCDELSRRIGAINTITIDPDGTLRGDNSDYAGAIDALCNKMQIAREGLAERAVAVLGAGGAARAIVAALCYYGAETTVHNRTLSRAETLAEEFGCKFAAIDKASSTEAQIIINCTSVGMHPNTGATPLPAIPPSVEVVFDTIYNPLETLLLADAKKANCLLVSGLDMFVNQAVTQFELWTGQPAPRDVMRQVAASRLG